MDIRLAIFMVLGAVAGIGLIISGGLAGGRFGVIEIIAGVVALGGVVLILAGGIAESRKR
jgi:hypothetical protein